VRILGSLKFLEKTYYGVRILGAFIFTAFCLFILHCLEDDFCFFPHFHLPRGGNLMFQTNDEEIKIKLSVQGRLKA